MTIFSREADLKWSVLYKAKENKAPYEYEKMSFDYLSESVPSSYAKYLIINMYRQK